MRTSKPALFYEKYKQLLPIIILAGYFLYSFATMTADYSISDIASTLTWKHYGAMIATALCIVSFFFFKRWYKYVLYITLLAVYAGFIIFSLEERTYFLKIGVIELHFPPVILICIIAIFCVNFKRIRKALA
ncbi:hypothetical protein ACTHGU_01205 [Chitinophagaceae bacterium MMS25-I14]